MKEEAGLRDRILGHATRRFLTHGFRRTSMEELSRELGISKKTLYRLFPSKAELLREVVFTQLHQIDRELETVADGESASFALCFEHTFEVIGGMLRQLSEPFLRDMARHAPGLWSEIEEFRRERIFGHIERLIRRGIKAGAVRSEVNPSLATQMLIVMAGSLLTPERLLELKISPAEALGQIGLLVSGGLLA